MKLDKGIKEKWPKLATRKGVIFHQDNARPHTSLVTPKKLLELGWEVIFASKNQTVHESGIMKLTERWQKVVEQNGQYIID